MADNRFVVGYAKLGTSSCKKCKQKIEKGSLRVGKVTANPFADEGGDMKQWYHPACIFETFFRARVTTKKIEDPEDAEGFEELEQEDKNVITKLIEDYHTKKGSKPSPRPKKTAQTTPVITSAKKKDPTLSRNRGDASNSSAEETSSGATTNDSATSATTNDTATSAKTTTTASGIADSIVEKDNSFREFRRLCAEIAEENSHLGKTKLVHDYITKGHSGEGFHGDVYLLMKLLLPKVEKTVYNLDTKQLVKLFSQIFGTSLHRMTQDLEQGDVAETIRWAFEESKILPPQKKSTLSLQEVNDYLDELSKETKEDEQQKVLTKVAKRCTSNDLKMFVRLIKHDLRINAGAKVILDGLNTDAYAAFQVSRDLRDVVARVVKTQSVQGLQPGLNKKLSIKAALMTPVLPMLAEACKSVEQAMKKCPHGFYAEIKYDGERVQVHKKGQEFKFFSRSLKPVMEHKIKLFRDFIPKAFITGNNLILDAEVLLVDNNTGNPLPFGTLGVHKQAAFKDASVCLFVFDCLQINDTNLMDKPLKERRQFLETNMTVVKNHIHLSEIKLIKKPEELQSLMARVFREGLEGLVLKDINGTYEPGKRHWLKVKKDYLHEGSMADSADLVVLGAYYGTGNKGGMMSIFLMGVYDPDKDRWVTVSKCYGGLDDKQLETLNKELDVVKISKDFSKVPSWLHINKSMTPDFVVANPKMAPVWEIIGAEFSKADLHTADGISIRFPRVQKIREDKTWREATDLPRLKLLFKKSKEKTDKDMVKALGNTNNDSDADDGGEDVGDDVDMEDEEDENDARTRREEQEKKDAPRVKENRKRAASEDENSSHEVAKKAKKPACKYGANCYQKNPQHFKDFDHPPQLSPPKPVNNAPLSMKTASSVNKSPSTKELQNPPLAFTTLSTDTGKLQSQGRSSKNSESDLPNIFQGCQIVLPKTLDQYKQLKRFVIAYDGDLLSEFDLSSATHIILDSPKPEWKKRTDAVMVKPEWLLACVRKKQLLPTEPYLV